MKDVFDEIRRSHSEDCVHLIGMFPPVSWSPDHPSKNIACAAETALHKAFSRIRTKKPMRKILQMDGFSSGIVE